MLVYYKILCLPPRCMRLVWWLKSAHGTPDRQPVEQLTPRGREEVGGIGQQRGTPGGQPANAGTHVCLPAATRLSPTVNPYAGSPGASPGLHCHTCTIVGAAVPAKCYAPVTVPWLRRLLLPAPVSQRRPRSLAGTTVPVAGATVPGHWTLLYLGPHSPLRRLLVGQRHSRPFACATVPR